MTASFEIFLRIHLGSCTHMGCNSLGLRGYGGNFNQDFMFGEKVNREAEVNDEDVKTSESRQHICDELSYRKSNL